MWSWSGSDMLLKIDHSNCQLGQNKIGRIPTEKKGHKTKRQKHVLFNTRVKRNVLRSTLFSLLSLLLPQARAQPHAHMSDTEAKTCCCDPSFADRFTDAECLVDACTAYHVLNCVLFGLVTLYVVRVLWYTVTHSPKLRQVKNMVLFVLALFCLRKYILTRAKHVHAHALARHAQPARAPTDNLHHTP